MIDRIEDECRDVSINSQVRDAIKTAINKYQFQRYWFNERGDLKVSLSTSQRIYTTLATPPTGVDLGNLLFIDSVRLAATAGGVFAKLRRREHEWIEARTQTTTGTPANFSYYQQQIYVQPLPSATMSMEIAAVIRFGTVSATADTNAWFTDGERLIRNEAKGIIYSDIKGDDAQAQKYFAIAAQEYERLIAETNARLGVNMVDRLVKPLKSMTAARILTDRPKPLSPPQDPEKVE
jgi:hypothetical protein